MWVIVRNGGFADFLIVAIELAGHPAVDEQAKIASGESVPGTWLLAAVGWMDIIEHVSLGEAPEDSRWSFVFAVGCDFFFFSFTQFLQIGAAGAKAEFSIEPEGTGVDGLVVVLTNLVGINRNPFRGGEGAQAAQGLGVDPRGFALAVGVEGIEANLDPLAEADGFDVVDGDAIF